MAWGQPIDLVDKDYQGRVTITSYDTALQWLLENPASSLQEGLHAAAIEACLAEMDGKAARARTLFIRTARGSGLLAETAHWHV